MKRIICIACTLLLAFSGLQARAYMRDIAKNDSADNLPGVYFIEYNGYTSTVRFFKTVSGSYNCQMYNMPKSYDKNGNVKLDTKNPNKELRNRPDNEIVIIWGLEYDKEKKLWNKGTIYDPTTGITANCLVEFVDGGKTLRVYGHILGIGKSLFWKVVEEGK